jgi:hypothetical protein
MTVLSRHRQLERRKPEEVKSEGAAPARMPRITAITSYSKGFACSAGPGTVCLFEKTEEKDNYRKTREIRVMSMFGEHDNLTS